MISTFVSGRQSATCIPATRSAHASNVEPSLGRVHGPPAGPSFSLPIRAGFPSAPCPHTSHSPFLPHALPTVIPEARSSLSSAQDSDSEALRMVALAHFRSLLESRDSAEAPNKLLGWSLDKAALGQVARQVWQAAALADDVKLGKLLLGLTLLSAPSATLTAGRAGIRTLALARMLGLRDFRMLELVSGDDMFTYSGSFDNANGDDVLSVNLSCARLQLALTLRPEVLLTVPSARPQLQADSETLERANQLQAKLQAHKQAIQQKRGEQLRTSMEESSSSYPAGGLTPEPELERMRTELAAIMKAMLMSSWHVGTSAENESPIGWILDMEKARQEASKTWPRAALDTALLKLGAVLVLLHSPGACMEVDSMAKSVAKLLDRPNWLPHKPMEVLEDDNGIFTTQMVPVGGSKSSMVVALEIPAYLAHRTKFITTEKNAKADKTPTPSPAPGTTPLSNGMPSSNGVQSSNGMPSSNGVSSSIGVQSSNGQVSTSTISKTPVTQQQHQNGVPTSSASSSSIAGPSRSSPAPSTAAKSASSSSPAAKSTPSSSPATQTTSSSSPATKPASSSSPAAKATSPSSPAAKAVSPSSVSAGAVTGSNGVLGRKEFEPEETNVPVLSASAAEYAAGLRSRGVKLNASSEMQQHTLLQAEVLGCLCTLMRSPATDIDPESPLGWTVDSTLGGAFARLIWPHYTPQLSRIKLGLLLVLLNEPSCTSTTKYAGPASCEVMGLDGWSPYRLRDIVGQDPIFCASPCEEEGHWSIHANLPVFLTSAFLTTPELPGAKDSPGKANAASALYDAARIAAEKAGKNKPTAMHDQFTLGAAAAAAAAVNARQQQHQQLAKPLGIELEEADEVVSSGSSKLPPQAEELVRASATWGSTTTELSTLSYQQPISPTSMAVSLAQNQPSSPSTTAAATAPLPQYSRQANEHYRTSITPRLTAMLKDHTSSRKSGGKDKTDENWTFRQGVAKVISGWLWPECPLDLSLVKLALSVALLSKPLATAPLQQAVPRVCELLSDKRYQVEDLKRAIDNDPVFVMTPAPGSSSVFNVSVNMAAFQEKVAAANAISEYQQHEEQQHNQHLQQIVALQARQRQAALINTPELNAQASSLRQKMLMAAMSRSGTSLPSNSSSSIQELTTSTGGVVTSGGPEGGRTRKGAPGVSQAASMLAQALIKASVNMAKRLIPGQGAPVQAVGKEEEDGRKWVVGQPAIGPAPAVKPPSKAMAFQETRAESMLARVVASVDADLNVSSSQGELGWTARCMVTNLPGGLAPVVGFAVARGRREAKQKAALRALTDLKGCGVDVYNILRQATIPGPTLIGEEEVVDLSLPVVKNIQMGGRIVAIGLTDASFPDRYLPLQQHMVLAATIISSYGVAVDMGLLRRALIVPRCNVKSSKRLAWIGSTQFSSAIKLWLDGASPADDDNTAELQEVYESYSSPVQCSTYLRDLGLERFVVTPAGHSAEQEELQSVFYAVIGAIYWSNRSEDEVYKFLCNSGIIRV